MRQEVEVKDLNKYNFEAAPREWIWNNIKEKKEELKNFDGICNLKEMISFHEEDGKLYTDCGYVLLEYKGYTLYPMKKHHNQNSYHFALNGVDYPNEYVRDFFNENERPKYVGKPTVAKMDEWLEYLLAMDKTINERKDKEIDFKAKYIESLKGRDVKWLGKTQGIICENGIEFEFQIGESSVYTKIRLGYKVPRNLETFDKLVKALD